MNGVQVVQISPTAVELRWKSSSSNDMIADSALALLLGIDGSPATAKRKSIFFLLFIHTVIHYLRQRAGADLPFGGLWFLVTASPNKHACNHSHSHSHSHSDLHPHTYPGDKPAKVVASNPEFERLRMFLEAHFGHVEGPNLRAPLAQRADGDKNGNGENDKDGDDWLTMDVKLDNHTARIDLISMVSLEALAFPFNINSLPCLADIPLFLFPDSAWNLNQLSFRNVWKQCWRWR